LKVYDFPAKITSGGSLELPDALVGLLPNNEMVRVIIMVNDQTDDDEDKTWSRLAAEQLLAQYDDADAIYDRL
jgi:hypothetical protein